MNKKNPNQENNHFKGNLVLFLTFLIMVHINKITKI